MLQKLSPLKFLTIVSEGLGGEHLLQGDDIDVLKLAPFLQL